LLWQNAEAAENGLIFQLVSVFQRSVTHSRGARVAHQAGTNQGWSLLCACMQFQQSSLHVLAIGINIQNLGKIKGVPCFFLVVLVGGTYYINYKKVKAGLKFLLNESKFCKLCGISS
jgi:hypothetical protein